MSIEQLQHTYDVKNKVNEIVDKVNISVTKISSVSELSSSNLVEGDVVELIGYHEDTAVGGGLSVVATARHNGGTAISLSRAFPNWAIPSEVEAWFADSGSDEVCIVRTVDIVTPFHFGAYKNSIGQGGLSYEAALSSSASIEIKNANNTLKIKEDIPFHFANVTSLNVFRGVDVTSNSSISGNDKSELRPYNDVESLGNSVQYIFSTGKPTINSKTYENINFRNITFEFNGVNGLTNPRGAYLTGVSGVNYENVKAKTNTVRFGYVSHMQNCENIKINNFDLKRVTGGLNFSYCNGVNLSNLNFDDFSEALDFDRVCKDVNANNIQFKNGGQCFDLNGVVNGNVSNIVAEDVGNLFTIQYKDTSPDTFSAYVTNTADGTMFPSRDITISNVKAENVNQDSDSPSILIGNDWSGIPHVGYPPVTNITLENIDLKNSGYIPVLEGFNITFRNVNLDNVQSPSSLGAIDMISQTGNGATFPDTGLTAKLENIRVQNATGRGFRSSIPNEIKIDGFYGRDNGSYDIDLTNLEGRSAVIYLDNIDVETMRISGAGDTFSVFWGENNRVGELTLVGNAHNRTFGKSYQIKLGDLPSTGTLTKQLFTANKKCLVSFASVISPSAATSTASNYRSFQLKDGSGGTISSVSYTTDWVAGQERTLGFSVSEPLALLEKGESITATITSAGAGAAITDCTVLLNVLYL